MGASRRPAVGSSDWLGIFMQLSKMCRCIRGSRRRIQRSLLRRAPCPQLVYIDIDLLREHTLSREIFNRLFGNLEPFFMCLFQVVGVRVESTEGLPLAWPKPSNAGDNLRFVSHGREYIRSDLLLEVVNSAGGVSALY